MSPNSLAEFDEGNALEHLLSSQHTTTRYLLKISIGEDFPRSLATLLAQICFENQSRLPAGWTGRQPPQHFGLRKLCSEVVFHFARVRQVIPGGKHCGGEGFKSSCTLACSNEECMRGNWMCGKNYSLSLSYRPTLLLSMP